VSGIAEWIGVLSTLASIAVALIGFSGLLIAFRAANDPLSRADIVNIRILLIFSLGGLIFALLPMPFAEVRPERLWPPLTVAIAAFLLFWPLRTPVWNRQRGVKPRRAILYWGVLSAEAVLGVGLLIAALSGGASGGTYALGVAWCLLVAIVTFVAHIFTLLPVDSH
jgi:hypothetical protein